MGGKCRPWQLADRSIPTHCPLHHAVVIEHRDTVGGDPDIALQPGGAELERQFETGKGVLGRVGPGSAMAEGDGVVEERRKALLHPE